MTSKNTAALYQTIIEGTNKLLTALKDEAKTNKRLTNAVGRIERLAKSLPVFATKYEKITAAPSAEKAKKPAAKKKAAPPAKAKAKKAAAKKKKAPAAAAPAPEIEASIATETLQ